MCNVIQTALLNSWASCMLRFCCHCNYITQRQRTNKDWRRESQNTQEREIWRSCMIERESVLATKFFSLLFLCFIQEKKEEVKIWVFMKPIERAEQSRAEHQQTRKKHTKREKVQGLKNGGFCLPASGIWIDLFGLHNEVKLSWSKATSAYFYYFICETPDSVWHKLY